MLPGGQTEAETQPTTSTTTTANQEPASKAIELINDERARTGNETTITRNRNQSQSSAPAATGQLETTVEPDQDAQEGGQRGVLAEPDDADQNITPQVDEQEENPELEEFLAVNGTSSLDHNQLDRRLFLESGQDGLVSRHLKKLKTPSMLAAGSQHLKKLKLRQRLLKQQSSSSRSPTRQTRRGYSQTSTTSNYGDLGDYAGQPSDGAGQQHPQQPQAPTSALLSSLLNANGLANSLKQHLPSLGSSSSHNHAHQPLASMVHKLLHANRWPNSPSSGSSSNGSAATIEQQNLLNQHRALLLASYRKRQQALKMQQELLRSQQQHQASLMDSPLGSWASASNQQNQNYAGSLSKSNSGSSLSLDSAELQQTANSPNGLGQNIWGQSMSGLQEEQAGQQQQHQAGSYVSAKLSQQLKGASQNRMIPVEIIGLDPEITSSILETDASLLNDTNGKQQQQQQPPSRQPDQTRDERGENQQASSPSSGFTSSQRLPPSSSQTSSDTQPTSGQSGNEQKVVHIHYFHNHPASNLSMPLRTVQDQQALEPGQFLASLKQANAQPTDPSNQYQLQQQQQQQQEFILQQQHQQQAQPIESGQEPAGGNQILVQAGQMTDPAAISQMLAEQAAATPGNPMAANGDQPTTESDEQVILSHSQAEMLRQQQQLQGQSQNGTWFIHVPPKQLEQANPDQTPNLIPLSRVRPQSSSGHEGPGQLMVAYRPQQQTEPPQMDSQYGNQAEGARLPSYPANGRYATSGSSASGSTSKGFGLGRDPGKNASGSQLNYQQAQRPGPTSSSADSERPITSSRPATAFANEAASSETMGLATRHQLQQQANGAEGASNQKQSQTKELAQAKASPGRSPTIYSDQPVGQATSSAMSNLLQLFGAASGALRLQGDQKSSIGSSSSSGNNNAINNNTRFSQTPAQNGYFFNSSQQSSIDPYRKLISISSSNNNKLTSDQLASLMHENHQLAAGSRTHSGTSPLLTGIHTRPFQQHPMFHDQQHHQNLNLNQLNHWNQYKAYKPATNLNNANQYPNQPYATPADAADLADQSNDGFSNIAVAFIFVLSFVTISIIIASMIYRFRRRSMASCNESLPDRPGPTRLNLTQRTKSFLRGNFVSGPSNNSTIRRRPLDGSDESIILGRSNSSRLVQALQEDSGQKGGASRSTVRLGKSLGGGAKKLASESHSRSISSFLEASQAGGGSGGGGGGGGGGAGPRNGPVNKRPSELASSKYHLSKSEVLGANNVEALEVGGERHLIEWRHHQQLNPNQQIHDQQQHQPQFSTNGNDIRTLNTRLISSKPTSYLKTLINNNNQNQQHHHHHPHHNITNQDNTNEVANINQHHHGISSSSSSNQLNQEPTVTESSGSSVLNHSSTSDGYLDSSSTSVALLSNRQLGASAGAGANNTKTRELRSVLKGTISRSGAQKKGSNSSQLDQSSSSGNSGFRLLAQDSDSTLANSGPLRPTNQSLTGQRHQRMAGNRMQTIHSIEDFNIIPDSRRNNNN